MKNPNQQACEQLRELLDISIQNAKEMMEKMKFDNHEINQTMQASYEALEDAVSFIEMLNKMPLDESQLIYIGKVHYFHRVKKILKEKLGGVKPC